MLEVNQVIYLGYILKWAKFLTKFRCSNHKFPTERLRYTNVPREERHCPFCNKKELGDGFNYVLQCPPFNTIRQKLLPGYCWKNLTMLN